jgi:hypothetical protein
LTLHKKPIWRGFFHFPAKPREGRPTGAGRLIWVRRQRCPDAILIVSKPSH